MVRENEKLGSYDMIRKQKNEKTIPGISWEKSDEREGRLSILTFPGISEWCVEVVYRVCLTFSDFVLSKSHIQEDPYL